MLNVVALNGRICGILELKHTASDIPVCSFTLAVDGFGKDKPANFIDIVCWRQTAEFAAKYFNKGQLVAVEGAIQTRSYEDKQGNKRKATEIVANQVHFAESKRNGFDEIERNVKAAGIDIQPTDNDFVEIGMNDSQLPF